MPRSMPCARLRVCPSLALRFAAALLLPLLLSPALMPAARAAPAAAAFDPAPTNGVTLSHGKGVDNLEFRFLDTDITDGKRIEHLSAQENGNALFIEVDAEREGSERVAGTWCRRLDCDPRNMIFTDGPVFGPGPSYPDKLNFWVSGQLLINGVPLRGALMLGQGHRPPITNNWWLGNAAARHDAQGLELQVEDARGQIYCFVSLGVHLFMVKACSGSG